MKIVVNTRHITFMPKRDVFVFHLGWKRFLASERGRAAIIYDLEGKR